MRFLLKKYLSREDVDAITAAIADVERFASGELRVCVRHRRHWNERKLSLHELALAEFMRLGMQKTKHRNGVLIFLLLSERKFQIIADEGIHKKVEEGTWDRIAVPVSSHFRKGNFRQGICEAIGAVGEELKRHFPRRQAETDELTNDVVEE